MAQRIKKTLYHYCSLDTFYNIINNKSIWLSDIEKSNDLQELKWLKTNCEIYITKYWLDYVKALDKKGELNPQVFDRYEETKKLSDLVNKRNVSKCWAFCLSEKQDDLGQWRGYADDGYGISIGFKSDFFRVVETLAGLNSIDEELAFRKVKYSKKQIEEFFLKDAMLGNISMDDDIETVATQIERAILMAKWNAAFFKAETFKEEKEWRIVYTVNINKLYEGIAPGMPNNMNQTNGIISFDKYRYIVKNRSLVSHMEMEIPHIGSIINEVCIGPKSPLEVSDIKLFLIAQGILKDVKDKSIVIYKSGVTYR